MSEFLIAIHALVYLGHCNTALNSEQLAENICVNPVRVRAVMKCFVDSGIVKTKRGHSGGYVLATSLEAISLADVAQTLHYELIHNNWYTGDENACCQISAGIQGYIRGLISIINIDIYNLLKKISLKEVETTILKRENHETL
ncbi:RrF2 family transcriptional regulator [Pelistega europaea]|uniref:Rrf2 family transcriptional regulator n=1 Tax=Pelistega europaea TaxID=106147 RepID=A0A7Y4L9G4_9BURK|nr:Rrf2 family transcriptional regulator [Pelistega europaea]NOL49343.1 Rrf2 family transcriptional regulator [Pelistega europaea]